MLGFLYDARKVEAPRSAPTSIRQRSMKVGFYFQCALAYDLEGLGAGTRQNEKSGSASLGLKTIGALFK